MGNQSDKNYHFTKKELEDFTKTDIYAAMVEVFANIHDANLRSIHEQLFGRTVDEGMEVGHAEQHKDYYEYMVDHVGDKALIEKRLREDKSFREYWEVYNPADIICWSMYETLSTRDLDSDLKDGLSNFVK